MNKGTRIVDRVFLATQAKAWRFDPAWREEMEPLDFLDEFTWWLQRWPKLQSYSSDSQNPRTGKNRIRRVLRKLLAQPLVILMGNQGSERGRGLLRILQPDNGEGQDPGVSPWLGV